MCILLNFVGFFYVFPRWGYSLDFCYFIDEDGCFLLYL